MNQVWTNDELIERFTLSPSERELLPHKTASGQLEFALLLKSFQYEGRFPADLHAIPKTVVTALAKQPGVSPHELDTYSWHGRPHTRYKVQIRKFLGAREWSQHDAKDLIEWLRLPRLPDQLNDEHVQESALQRLRNLRIEPPSSITLDRILHTAMRRWEDTWFHALSERLSAATTHAIDHLLSMSHGEQVDEANSNSQDGDDTAFWEFKTDTEKISLKSIATEASKLERIRQVSLPPYLLSGIAPKVLKRYQFCD